MSWESGTASSHSDLLNKLNTFLTKGHALRPTYTGTGTGLITGLIGSGTSVQETITVTFTSATDFSVSGSVTGAMGTGTVGTLFTHARVTFTIQAGGTAWASGDTIAFVMTAPWIADRSVAGSEMIWHAPGNAGGEAIYVGAKAFSNVTGDYYNWWLSGMTGFDSGLSFEAQPGALHQNGAAGSQSQGLILHLWNGSIPYWFIADGRRVIVVAHVSTVYTCAYMGLIETPYMSPGQWSYPLMIGGSGAWQAVPALDSTTLRWSYAADENRNFFYPRAIYANRAANYYQAIVRLVSGTWCGFAGDYNSDAGAGNVYPLGNSGLDLRPNLDGSYPRIPLIFHQAGAGGTDYNHLGQLDAVAWVTGHANAAENILTDGRDSWLVIPNVYRSTKKDYAAFRLS